VCCCAVASAAAAAVQFVSCAATRERTREGEMTLRATAATVHRGTIDFSCSVQGRARAACGRLDVM
jgi:hypothetical protein